MLGEESQPIEQIWFTRDSINICRMLWEFRDFYVDDLILTSYQLMQTKKRTIIIVKYQRYVNIEINFSDWSQAF